MKKSVTISIGMISLAVLLLSGCGQIPVNKHKKNENQSYIKLQAEDASLITACTEIAEYRLMSYYPQFRFSTEYSDDGTSVISFDADENWDESKLEQICRYGRLTFRKGTDTETDDEGNTVPTGEIILENSDISKAEVNFIDNGMGQEYSVHISMNAAGSDKFSLATSVLAGKDIPLSIWFDNELISSPKVTAPITNGEAVITGNFDADSAAELANAIDSGAMPCALAVIDHKIVTSQDNK
jgi:uncharacterized protein YceK